MTLTAPPYGKESDSLFSTAPLHTNSLSGRAPLHTIVQILEDNSEVAELFRFVADSPTTTQQRLKAFSQEACQHFSMSVKVLARLSW